MYPQILSLTIEGSSWFLVSGRRTQRYAPTAIHDTRSREGPPIPAQEQLAGNATRRWVEDDPRRAAPARVRARSPAQDPGAARALRVPWRCAAAICSPELACVRRAHRQGTHSRFERAWAGFVHRPRAPAGAQPTHDHPGFRSPPGCSRRPRARVSSTQRARARPSTMPAWQHAGTFPAVLSGETPTGGAGRAPVRSLGPNECGVRFPPLRLRRRAPRLRPGGLAARAEAVSVSPVLARCARSAGE